MFITIIAEPRSGSTNLANWFYFKQDFTVLFEPITNKNLRWYKNGEHIDKWKYDTPNLLVKEVYNDYHFFDELINKSDKVIILFRENEKKQSESWINAKKTNNWDKNWIDKGIADEMEFEFFKQLKKSFFEKFLTKNYFNISYEDLYYNNGFGKIIEYIGIDTLENYGFPYGKKYRIEQTKII